MANEQESKRGNASRGGKSGPQQSDESADSALAGATQSARQLGQAAVETFHEYSEQATQTYEQSREHVNQWISDLRQRAADEPIKTVLMATGVGIVLGVLFG
jgi:ElaB/YqjD/DUF883 family membrane-anchored ribosome-binding protein